MDEKELRQLLELVAEAYKAAGKDIVLATLEQDGEQTIMIDNREPDDLN